MEQISFFFNKFKLIGLKSVLAKQALVKAVEEIVRADISEESVEFRSGTFYLKNITPALKSELFLKKEKINEKLLKILGGVKPPSIH